MGKRSVSTKDAATKKVVPKDTPTSASTMNTKIPPSPTKTTETSVTPTKGTETSTTPTKGTETSAELAKNIKAPTTPTKSPKTLESSTKTKKATPSSAKSVKSSETPEQSVETTEPPAKSVEPTEVAAKTVEKSEPTVKIVKPTEIPAKDKTKTESTTESPAKTVKTTETPATSVEIEETPAKSVKELKEVEKPPVKPKTVVVATAEIRSKKEVEMAQGLVLTPDGEASFTVWAPHATNAFLRLEDPPLLVPLDRNGDHFSVRLVPGHVKHGDRYRVEMDAYDKRITRRDPFARATDYESDWCTAQDDANYKWTVTDWKRPEFLSYIIYELHVGSFTEEGTFLAAIEKLDHVASLGFTCVQLMPILEHSDEWGYNPRQFFSLHGGYGSPDELKLFVDEAHKRGLAVIIDVVLHHASVSKNALWNYDGWSDNKNGGIYHEGAQDTEWGRSLAYWKREVMHMLEESCAQWLTNYRCDGLRFDSANDLPHDICRTLTSYAHKQGPGSYLTAEVTPENPKAVHELGFDALWVHSGYFDIIHQHRALGRGHHGGGDYADGWDFPRLRTVMGLHYGFTSPLQCIKYILGSHDQVGCKNGGAIYEDYKMIGGQHRYAPDQFGAGRTDPWACSATRAWLVANATAAGIPMFFMGTEWAATGWWDTYHRQADWALTKDEIGKGMMECLKDSLAVRKKFVALQIGGTNTLHEDRNNGVLAVDRIWEGQRVIVVINAGRDCWQNSEYRVWVGGEGYAIREVLCSADKKYGGWSEQHGNGDTVIGVYGGFASINIPSQSSMVFEIVPC